MEKRSILLVEDDRPVRELIRDNLEPEYDVIEASCYGEAIMHIKEPFCITLVDYVLPDRDGLELIRAIREEKPVVPIILMTAYDHKTAALNAARAGATAYLKKPFSLKLLPMRIAAILKGRTGPEGDSDLANVRREEFVMDGIKEHIEKNFMKDLSIDELAEMAGMSKFTFCRAFKRRFGSSCVSYLNSFRVENAAELLKNHDLNITEVASFVGFSSVEYFDRVFHTARGMSPREFRKKRLSDSAV